MKKWESRREYFRYKLLSSWISTKWRREWWKREWKRI